MSAEFTNWRGERRAWRGACALLDQSHHMTDLRVSGPDARRLPSDVGTKAKQYVATGHDGYPGGGVVRFPWTRTFGLAGHPMVHDRVRYDLATGGHDVLGKRDDSSADRAYRDPGVEVTVDWARTRTPASRSPNRTSGSDPGTVAPAPVPGSLEIPIAPSDTERSPSLRRPARRRKL